MASYSCFNFKKNPIMFLLCSILLILINCKFAIGFEYFLSNISGEVEKGNFAYYRMEFVGTILLELTSFSGDCDLYVSQNTEKPGYEPDSNCMSSISCGIDSVIIPKSFKRPVGIGIFSHPSHDVCLFNLMFQKIHDSKDIFNYNSYENSLNADTEESDPKANIIELLEEHKKNTNTLETEEKLYLWVFIKYFAAFLMELII